MLGFPLGALFGWMSAWLTGKVLSSLLTVEGNAPKRGLLVAGKPLLHAAVLTIAALVSPAALLWTAAGDVLALIGYAVFQGLKKVG